MSNRYFEVGLNASRHYIVDEAPGYICPTCLKIIRNLTDLSEEHVPPEALGGKVLCLTCKECNNRSGHSIDAAMHERLEMLKILHRGTNRRFVQLKIDKLTVNASIKRTGENADLILSKKHNDPKKVREFIERAYEPGIKLDVWYKNKYSQRQALIGYLRAAYLYAFAKFGYAYILRECLDPIRSQIAKPNDTIILQWWLRRKENLDSKMIYICDKPINCVLVGISDHIIVLPPFDEPYDQYERVKEITNETSENDFIGKFYAPLYCNVPTGMELAYDPK